MERHEPHAEELLLDLHLDRISEDDRLWLEAELDRDAKLAEMSDRLRQVLRPLDHWTVPSMPENLVDKALKQMERSRVLTSVPAGMADDLEYHGRSFRVPLREILAAAACIALLAMVFVPGVSELRSRAQRATCASHLGSVFQGARLYQATFGDSLPFAGNALGASWLPGGGRPYASNSRHVYLVAKLNFGPKPENFICPASHSGEPMPADVVSAHSDFAHVRNNSYDSLNLSGPNPNLRPSMPIAYLSDANPLFKDGRFDDLVDPTCTNSPIHADRGQNVLTLDGGVHWMTSPIYGASRDNLWLAGDIRRYTGIEVPTRKDDAQLVPGYPTTDPKIQSLIAQ